jgi:hypothetical protein
LKVSNQSAPAGDTPLSDLLRFQAEFQARLAEETLRYLRKLHGTIGPATPGTVVAADSGTALGLEGHPGARVEETIEIENRQRVHAVATPALTPLVSAAGATWFPAVEVSPASVLVPPDETAAVSLAIDLPGALEPGVYRGALLFQGFRDGGIPVTVTVTAPAPPPAAPARRRTPKPRARRGSSRNASRRTRR